MRYLKSQHALFRHIWIEHVQAKNLCWMCKLNGNKPLQLQCELSFFKRDYRKLITQRMERRRVYTHSMAFETEEFSNRSHSSLPLSTALNGIHRRGYRASPSALSHLTPYYGPISGVCICSRTVFVATIRLHLSNMRIHILHAVIASG